MQCCHARESGHPANVNPAILEKAAMDHGAVFVATCLAAAGDEPTEYIPALIIALMIPLSYSIATGIGLGFTAYVALKALAGRFREINAASAVVAGAFQLKLIFA